MNWVIYSRIATVAVYLPSLVHHALIKPYSVRSTLTTLTIKSADPFYNFHFNYSLLLVSNQPFVLVKPPVWTKAGGHID